VLENWKTGKLENWKTGKLESWKAWARLCCDRQLYEAAYDWDTQSWYRIELDNDTQLQPL
jgi:hypothetical protein